MEDSHSYAGSECQSSESNSESSASGSVSESDPHADNDKEEQFSDPDDVEMMGLDGWSAGRWAASVNKPYPLGRGSEVHCKKRKRAVDIIFSRDCV